MKSSRGHASTTIRPLYRPFHLSPFRAAPKPLANPLCGVRFHRKFRRRIIHRVRYTSIFFLRNVSSCTRSCIPVYYKPDRFESVRSSIKIPERSRKKKRSARGQALNEQYSFTQFPPRLNLSTFLSWTIELTDTCPQSNWNRIFFLMHFLLYNLSSKIAIHHIWERYTRLRWR